MPIRFRCKYCNQLLGIARRKAGTSVHCPTCHGRLMVPPPVRVAAPGALEQPAPFFEHNDFEDFLHPQFDEGAIGREASPQSGPAAHAAEVSPLLVDVEQVPKDTQPVKLAGGIFLSKKRLFLLAVVVVLLLVVAFITGIFVDHFFFVSPLP